MSIRWKIALLCMLTAVVPLLVLNKHSVRVFDQFTSKALEEQMIDAAFMLGQEYRLLQSLEELPLARYQQETGTRLRLVGTNGVVLADSDHEAPMVGEDLSGLREIAKAMTGRYGARSSLTPDRRFMYYYCALPVTNETGLMAISYASRNTDQITKTIIGMAKDFRLAILLTLVVAALASILLAHTMTRRLRRLSRLVQRFAQGKSSLTLEDKRRDEIGELAQSFSMMAEEIGDKNRYNRDFLADTAHELKTPLTAIKGAVELLAEGAGEQAESREKFLKNIEFETERLTRMVTQLSELTQLDAEEIRGQKSPVKYIDFLASTLERIRPAFEEPHAEIRLNQPDEDREVPIVPERIEQVLANLLENAIRYTPAEGKIEIGVEIGDSEVTTFVRDTGSGMDEADLARVFHRFFTTEPKAQVKDYGSGLGLSIARSIVENHGGRIWAESKPGAGATFYFSLPLE